MIGSFTQSQKQIARLRVSEAVRDGKIAKPDSCSLCGSDGIIEGHHSDYLEPINIDWLCKECHRELHKNVGFSKTTDIQTLNIRMWEKSWKRLKLKAIKRGVTLMELVDELSLRKI